MEVGGIDVIILGGGKCDDPMRVATGCEFRSQIPVFGQRLGDIAIESATKIGRTIFVGPEGFPASMVVPGGSTFTQSLRNGLESAADRVMVVTADLPLLTPSILQAFVDDWGDFEGIVYAVCEEGECHRVAPGMKRTCVRCLEGRLTGGNVVGAPKEMLVKLLDLIERAYDDRKNPVRLAKLLGGKVIGQLLMSKLTPFPPSVLDVGREVGKIIGCPVQILLMPEAEIATDIDSLEQLKAFETLKNSP